MAAAHVVLAANIVCTNEGAGHTDREGESTTIHQPPGHSLCHQDVTLGCVGLTSPDPHGRYTYSF